MIEFSKLVADATIPTRQTDGSAGFDLCSIENVEIQAGDWMRIRTGISLSIPEKHVGLIKPRSGLAVNYGLDVLAGVIDSDYRGELIVVLINFDNSPYYVSTGDRIAQLIVTPIVTDSIVVNWMDDTERGSNGFGSTGV